MKVKFLAGCVLISIAGIAQGKVFATKDGAIRGYDPVSYIVEMKPVKGSKEFTYDWNDATWFFSTKENLNLFTKNPIQYAPQYGGFCAYGASQNYKVKTEADAWTVVDGKLYLNWDKDVSKIWNTNRDECIKKADKNWIDLENK